MIKVIISVVAAMGLFLASIFTWSAGHDILAVILLASTVVLSCFFEEGRKEIYEDNERD